MLRYEFSILSSRRFSLILINISCITADGVGMDFIFSTRLVKNYERYFIVLAYLSFECKCSIRSIRSKRGHPKHIFLNKSEGFLHVDFRCYFVCTKRKREKLFAKLLHHLKYESVIWGNGWSTKGKSSTESFIIVEWWLMTVTNTLSSTAANLKKTFSNAKKESADTKRTEKKNSIKNRFSFSFFMLLPSMGFSWTLASQSSFWVAKKTRRKKRFIKMCCSRACW